MADSGGPRYSRRRPGSDYDHLLKVILVGDEGTGKSSLMSRYCDNVFHFTYISTIGVDFKIRTLDLDVDDVASKVKIQMWDTAGQERFASITSSFYRGADAVLVVYDVGCPSTFVHTRKWLEACTSVCDDTANSRLVKVLIGNKADLAPEGQGGVTSYGADSVRAPSRGRRLVTKEEGEAMAMESGMAFYETSAKDDINVTRLFEDVAATYVQQQRAAGAGTTGVIGRRRAARPDVRTLRLADMDVTGDGVGCWARLLQAFSSVARRGGKKSGGAKLAMPTPTFAQ